MAMSNFKFSIEFILMLNIFTSKIEFLVVTLAEVINSNSKYDKSKSCVWISREQSYLDISRFVIVDNFPLIIVYLHWSTTGKYGIIL